MIQLPLTGKHILLGRNKSEVSPLEERLRAAGARVTCVPLIEVHPLAEPDVSDVYLQPDIVVITSKNSVDGYGLLRPVLGDHVLAVVGKRTADACEKRGFIPDIVGSGDGAVALLETLVAENAGDGIRGKRILYPCSSLVTDEFATRAADQGAVVDMVPVYQTTMPDGLLEALPDRADVVVFYSSSGARHFHEVKPFASVTNTVAVAMGVQTATTLRSLGAPHVSVAKKPDVDALIDAIVAGVNPENREDCE